MDKEFTPNFRKSQIFKDDEEKELPQYILTAEKTYDVLTPKEFRRRAYLYAVENGKQVPQ